MEKIGTFGDWRNYPDCFHRWTNMSTFVISVLIWEILMKWWLIWLVVVFSAVWLCFAIYGGDLSRRPLLTYHFIVLSNLTIIFILTFLFCMFSERFRTQVNLLKKIAAFCGFLNKLLNSSGHVQAEILQLKGARRSWVDTLAFIAVPIATPIWSAKLGDSVTDYCWMFDDNGCC